MGCNKTKCVASSGRSTSVNCNSEALHAAAGDHHQEPATFNTTNNHQPPTTNHQPPTTKQNKTKKTNAFILFDLSSTLFYVPPYFPNGSHLLVAGQPCRDVDGLATLGWSRAFVEGSRRRPWKPHGVWVFYGWTNYPAMNSTFKKTTF